MKPNYSPYAIMLGSFIGIGLCFAFYRITGLHNPTFFTDASLWRKAADLTCLVAFCCLGNVLAFLLFRLVTPSAKPEPGSNPSPIPSSH